MKCARAFRLGVVVILPKTIRVGITLTCPTNAPIAFGLGTGPSSAISIRITRKRRRPENEDKSAKVARTARGGVIKKGKKGTGGKNGE